MVFTVMVGAEQGIRLLREFAQLCGGRIGDVERSFAVGGEVQEYRRRAL